MSKQQWKAIALALIAGLTSLALIVVTPVVSQAQVSNVSQFSDLRSTDWFYQSLQSLVEKYGVVKGYADNTFRGNDPPTRGTFAVWLNDSLNALRQVSEQDPKATACVKQPELESLKKTIVALEQKVRSLQ
jgi:hypothetical protein